MNQEETVALFRECEEARNRAREAKKTEDEAHEVAKAMWNAWADGMLAEKKALIEAGMWAVEKKPRKFKSGKNNETQNWLYRACANFRDVRFETKLEKVENTVQSHDSVDPHKSILVSDNIYFVGFKFPGLADFHNTHFLGGADLWKHSFSMKQHFTVHNLLAKPTSTRPNFRTMPCSSIANSQTSSFLMKPNS
jgi:hypothetical protein